MRVRYGKPIKVKSLVGNQTSFSFLGGSSTMDTTLGDCVYQYNWSLNSTKTFNINITTGHIYLEVVRVEELITKTPTFYYKNTSGSSVKPYSAISPLTEDGHILIGSMTAASNYVCGYFTLQRTDITLNLKPEYYFVIDLTNIFGSGNEPTAQQFYNKYNKYFPLIATGEEITLDDKAGQVAYKNLEEDSIRCKVAGGSSDIYYGYNQVGPAWVSGSYNGVDVTAVNDGIDIELSGTATGWFTYNKTLGKTLPSGHKILVCSEAVNPTSANFGYRLRYNSDNPIYANKEFNKIHTLTGDVNIFQVYADLGDNLTGVELNNLSIIDLTDWFGAGKEPSTVAEFKEKFTKDYYGFCPTPIKLTRYQIEALPNYGYNQLFKIGSGNKCARTYGDDGEFILTANSSTTHTYFGLVCYGENYNLDSIKGHKALCIANVTEISISSGFTNITSTWALSNITDRNLITEPGIVYGIGTWRTVNQTYINVSRSSGTFTQGDYFKIKDVQIIDLTDWYGAGSEPTTLAEFKETFPNTYYLYSKKRLLNKYMINKLES